MGNYCSSGQNKKDKDNSSQKSEDSPTYQLASKNKKFDKSGLKAAPLVDPEPTSDISNFNAAFLGGGTNGQTSKAENSSTVDINRPSIKAIQGIHSTSANADSTSSSPLTLNAPCELTTLAPSNQQKLPQTLTPIYGKPSQSRRIETDKKIVLYILAADDGHKAEKSALTGLYDELQQYCACRGFELHLCDAHEQCDNFLDPDCWTDVPFEARCGHHLAAQCLSEITRFSNHAYIVPVLFFGTSLGSPLLPLTIESQDFVGALTAAAPDSTEKQLLERWYELDEKSEPPCYRLKSKSSIDESTSTADVEQLYNALVTVFSKELRDSYLTSVIEQEINNTVLFSQELSKRCIWIHTGALPTRTTDDTATAECEVSRRVANIQAELKNQLNEKNLIRIPPSVQMTTAQLATSLKSLLLANIDNICDDHTAKFQIPFCTFGVDRNLLTEIEAVNRHSSLLSQNCANFEIMDRIKQYVTSSSASEPLIVCGPNGCGKSALSAKISQIIHSWLPYCCFVLRYAGLTPLSNNVTALIGSIAEQINYFTKTEPCSGPHTIANYTEIIRKCIDESKFQIIILIDSLDKLSDLNSVDWLPTNLPENVKIIVTSSTATDVGQIDPNDAALALLKKKLSAGSFVHLKQFSETQWGEVLSYGGGDFYSTNALLKLPDSWKNCPEKIPLQAKLLWWMAWLGKTDLTDISIASVCDKVFEVLENEFGKNVVRYLISLIVASRHGLTETELINLLRQSKRIDDSLPNIWMKFCWFMSRGPMLRQNNRIKLMDDKLRCCARERYANDIQNAHEILHDFYNSQPNIFLPPNDNGTIHQSINHSKFIELPYHAFIIANRSQTTITSFVESVYLCDLNWIQMKLKTTKCVQYILNDIHLIDDALRLKYPHLNLLNEFFEINKSALNYDSSQFYPLLKYFIKKHIADDSAIVQNVVVQKWIEAFETIPISYLDIVDISIDGNENSCDEATTDNGFDFISNLGGNGYFVASLNTEREEICVWDVPRCKKVRILKGIPQPTSLCPVGDYGAAVLSRREIKIIDLNKGAFRVTLKGVMNQKMPFFAYCNDAKHLICLSRNRMYVNLMNLESGDCITTFKAGEDRFLNSLLVSGDGRILVCGDETQKPFPLLVWHLSQRKLLYDLRIPHHDFITSLSAITNEGSYVCVVAKEVNEPAPNFIVVYDLQSGTLFKKWKPSCNTVSLSISQANACVIAGLEDARILIWDLVTGNCKFVLIGHTAPVTLLKLDPSGSILLSADKEGRDKSVRLWELGTGKAVAVHTPSKRVSTCEILPNGKYIVLALENEPNLVTLELKNCPTNQNVDCTDDDTAIYGDIEFNGKTFQL